jgi:hypothetical protein
MDYCTSQFKIKSTRGWINSFVLRASDEVIQIRVAQEEQGSPVSSAFPERIIQELHNYIEGCVAELVFSFDEVGISDWDDRETKKVKALAAMFGRRYIMGYPEM